MSTKVAYGKERGFGMSTEVDYGVLLVILCYDHHKQNTDKQNRSVAMSGLRLSDLFWQVDVSIFLLVKLFLLFCHATSVIKVT